MIRPGTGSAGRSDSRSPWTMAIALAPWRVVGENPVSGQTTVWQVCADDDALAAAKQAIPPQGSLVEIVVEAPDRIPGLEFRGRAASEFLFVRWAGVVADVELAALAVETEPPARVTDAVLGELTWNEQIGRYQTMRTTPDGTYRLSIEPDDSRSPEPEIASAGPRVLEFERRLARLQLDVARKAFGLWNDAWRDEDDPELTVEEFASRLSLKSLSIGPDGTLGSAYYSDGGLFCGHAIEVSWDADGEVESTNLVG
jgi:hypothetical protein